MSDDVPLESRNFIKSLHRCLTAIPAPPLSVITQLYVSEYPKLIQRYFKSTPMNDPELMMELVQSDGGSIDLTMMLYRQLYYRHITQKMQPTIDDRIETFENYVNLFNSLLSQAASKQATIIELPAVWLFDLIDDFTSQFISFQQYAQSLQQQFIALQQDRNSFEDDEIEEIEQEVAILREGLTEGRWNVTVVFKYLQAIAMKGGCDSSQAEKKQELQAEIAQQYVQFGQLLRCSLITFIYTLCYLVSV